MKKTILFIVGISLMLSVYGQKQAKYEDYLPIMLALPPSGAIALLKTYRTTEPENGSIHLQLATIYNKRYAEGDPIKNFQYKIGNAELALQSYELAEQIITEKDIRRNSASYFNFGSVNAKGKLEVSYDSLSNNIINAKADLIAYINNGPIIYEKFTTSFSYYDQAHKLFTEVVGEYATFKDLYLLFNADLDGKLEKLKQAYLQSISYFDEYKNAIGAYPINYNQALIVEEILVYRLNGLEAQINFLEPKISVWNYAKWVDNTRATIADEIKALRESLIVEDIRLNNSIANVSSRLQNDDYKELKVSKEVLFNLRKYDLNSVVEPTFRYKEKQHDLLYHDLLSKSLDTDDNISEDRRLFLYGQLINKLIETDSSLTNITEKNDDVSSAKYGDFIQTQYGSQEGIETYVNAERASGRNLKSSYINLLQEKLILRINADTLKSEAKYKKKMLRLYVSPAQDSLSFDSAIYITTHKVINFDSSAFIAGTFIHPKEKKMAAFTAGVTKDGKIGWYNEHLLEVDSGVFDADTRVGAMTRVPGGIGLVLNANQSSTGKKTNKTLIINETGETTFERRLNTFHFPREILYNDIDNSLTIVFKGNHYLEDITIENELVLANFTLLGDLQWQHRFKFKGDVTGVLNIGEAYLVLGNYKEMRSLSGQIKRADTSPLTTNTYLLKFNKSGMLDIRFIENIGSSHLLESIKISNDCINLFGNKGEYNKNAQLQNESGTWFHILINRNLEILSSNL
jgi:hypothetical protein